MQESADASNVISATANGLPFEELSYKIDVDDLIAWSLVARSGYFGMRGVTIRNFRFAVGLLLLVMGLLLACFIQGDAHAKSVDSLTALVLVFVGSVYSWCFFGPVWRWRLGRKSRSLDDLPVLTRLKIADSSLSVSMPHVNGEVAWARFKGVEETENHFFLRVTKLVAYTIPKRALNDQRMVADFRAFLAGKISEYEEVK